MKTTTAFQKLIVSTREAMHPPVGQPVIAARVGVPRSTVYRWEQGMSVPDAIYLAPLARALGLPVARLREVALQTREAARKPRRARAAAG